MNLQQAIAANDALRDNIIRTAMPRFQPLPPVTVSGTITSSNNIVTINPVLAGLLCGFIIEVNSTITNTGGSSAARTDFGAFNAIDRIQFTDTNNYLRHNTKGYHFAMLDVVKQGRAYGGAVAPNLPTTWGNINTVQTLATPVAATTGSNALRAFYYVPVAYDFRSDLRGAIWAQVVNSTMPLQLTLNANAGYTTGDPLNAIAGGASTVVLQTAVTIKVTQVYYDQIGRDPADGQPLLPPVDLSWNYQCIDTIWSSLTANVDNTFAYANGRTFLSTFAIYDNAGVFNTGSDVTYWKLQYANSYVQWQFNPETVFLNTRNQINFDLNAAVYYFDHRTFPIATVNFGNCDLVLQPSAVTTNATVWVGYEFMATNNALRSASSLSNS